LAIDGADIDVLAFDVALKKGDPVALEAAVALYRGELLEGCSEEWVLREREARESGYLGGLERLADQALASGRPGVAVGYLRRVVVVDGYRESAYRGLMLALAAESSFGEVVQVYRELRLKLRDGLNADPDPETTALFAQLRQESRRRVRIGRANQDSGAASIAGRTVQSDITDHLAVVEERSNPTLTLLFTDIEGSTRLWEQHPQAMRAALARHDSLLQQAIERHGGEVFKTVGDAFCAVFASATDAVTAAVAAQRALQSEAWPPESALRVRMALHTGTVERRGDDYFGQAVNRVAGLLSLGHGGQTLLTSVVGELLGDVLPDGVRLEALGRRRIKGVEEPLSVFELRHPSLTGGFPALHSPIATFSHNLSEPLTSFVGREVEIEEIKALLGKTRLLTLTGSGGCGKTRLALEVGRHVLEEYPDGVWLVELASLADPGLVVQRVASALEIKEQEGQPLQRTLLEVLKSRRLLLVLDNCEHLVSACADLADALLRLCPQVKVLATSRQALQVGGEQSWRVPSLTPPDLERLSAEEQDVARIVGASDAVRLFVERASAQRAEFRLTDHNARPVASVCWHLDGIPLAIELAAARVSSLSAEEIERRLDQRFRLLTARNRAALPRHQTLQALIDWSYYLLIEPERLLLRRLAVFAGGWTLDACEQVCTDAGIETWETIDLLTSLVDKSLVLYEEKEGEARYRLLETVRQYALERLQEEDGEVLLKSRHLEHFLTWAEQAEPKLHGPEQVMWLQRLEREHDNLRAALDWSQQHDTPEMGLRLAGALYWFWHLHSHLSEGRARLEDLLSRTQERGRVKERAVALQGAAQLAFYQSDYVAARKLFEESASIFREIGDDPGLAYALVYLGLATWWTGDHSPGFALSKESVALGRVLNDPWRLGMALWSLGSTQVLAGDHESALPFLLESASLLRSVGDKWELIGPLIYLGDIKNGLGEYEAARVAVREALILSQEVGDRWRVGFCLDSLGETALAEGDNAQARAFFEESLAVCREMGNSRRIAYELRNLGHAVRLQGKLEEARDCYEESLTLYLQLEQKRNIVYTLDGFARLFAVLGRAEHAARLFGAVEALRVPMNAPFPARERNDYDRSVAAARSALDSERFSAAWAEGSLLSLEQAIAYAIGDTQYE
jgi:predicted ATPase/class 3 adenylate cyclase